MRTTKTGKPDVLLSEADAAALLGVSIDTVRRERRDAKIAHVVVRGSIRIPTSSLDAYVAARTVGGAA